MIKSLIVLIFSFAYVNNMPDSESKAKLEYIESYKDIAIAEMYRTGIPASIILAQGIHESQAGRSELAKNANNHFGIKCKSYWKGDTYYYKDDDVDKNNKIIESCFRNYDSALESYIDHSNFLKQSSNYTQLFQYSNTDFANWAWGLQTSGYATDKKYAIKLIKIIEEFKLYQYDMASDPWKENVK
ncbi:MAG: glucosaminidase domain-containing protein [Saprospiraceae bacterium]